MENAFFKVKFFLDQPQESTLPKVEVVLHRVID